MTTEQIQFIAQQVRAKHLGKKVFTHPEYGKEGPVKLVRAHLDVYVNGFGFEYYLQLRPIEALTGDEAITLSSINRCFHSEYLTQIGIAIPHLIVLPNGETFTASVEWQIEHGIIQLIK
jgi:hypothetical protein